MRVVGQMAGVVSLLLLPCVVIAQDRMEGVRGAYDRQNFHEVIAQLRDDPLESAEAARLLGLSLYRLPDPRAAVPVLKRALELNPRDLEVIQALGNSLRISGDLDGALLHAGTLAGSGASQVGRLLMGAVEEDRGRLDEAAGHYRAAMSGPDPGHARQAASALADLLHRRGRHAEAAEAAAAGLALRSDRLSAAHFESMQPMLPPPTPALQLRLGYRLEYDDNIPQVPGDTGLSGITEESGFRHVLTGDLTYRRPLTDRLSLFGEAYLYQSIHQDSDLDEFNFTRLNVLGGLGGSWARGGWRVPLEVLWEGLDGSRYQTTLSALPGVYWSLAENWVVHFYGRLSSVDFANPIRPGEDRSGAQWRAGVFIHGRPVEALELRLIGEYGSNNTDGDNWQLDEWRIYGLAEYRFTPRLRGGFAVQYRERDFDNVNDLFLTRRKDEVVDLFLSLSWQLTESWRLRAQYSHQDQDSSIDFFSFDRNVYSIGLSWEF